MRVLRYFFQALAALFAGFTGRDLQPLTEPAPPVSSDPDPDAGSALPSEPPEVLIPDPGNADDWGPASSIARAMLRNGFQVFDNNEQDLNLNIVAIRNTQPVFDRFNCRWVHFWRDPNGEWQMNSWAWTTYPGYYYTIEKLLNPNGVAILAPGQYPGAYRIDSHRGIYPALCQRGTKVRVFRDGNRDRIYDMEARTIQDGWFGINSHATENPDNGVSKPVANVVGRASAGCLVAARVMDFVDARRQWNDARQLWGNSFSVSLIEDFELDDPGTVTLEAATPQFDQGGKKWQPTGQTVGIRNRNPLNVKGASDWKYSLGRDSKGHHIFPSFPKGLRAGLITLRTYRVRHRLNTIAEILSRWAPVTDTIGSIPGAPPNSPADYAKFVGARMNYGVNSPLNCYSPYGDVVNPDRLFDLVSAMVEYENYAGLDLPRWVFDQALQLMEA